MLIMHNQNEVTAKTFDEYKESYSDTVNDSIGFSGLDVDFFTRVKADYLVDICTKHFGDTKDLSLIDIGCGIGNFDGLLRPKFKALTGVDISPQSVEQARSRHTDVEYHTYNGETLPFENNSFDAAFAICVVHHVPVDLWENFSKEMYRVIKPGGLAMIFEHNPSNPLTMRVVNNCPFDEDAVLLKSQKSMSLLSGADFEDVKRRYILTIPAFNKLFRAFDGLFSWMKIGAQYYVTGTKAKD